MKTMFAIFLMLGLGLYASDTIIDSVESGSRVPGISHSAELQSTIVAKGPDILNASAMDIDERGNIFVVETYRFHRGVDDNRKRRHWVAQDTGLQTPEDRLKMYEGYADKYAMDTYSKYADRIVQLRDKDGDGVFETRSIFADGFNDPLDGMASGILSWEGKTYFACIPNIWMLKDKDDDGVADSRDVMHHGFGVRVSISGHDLNGFVWGPDGKIYGSVGDRGYNLKTPEGKTFKDPVGGCAFRMNPDGSEFEVFYSRLRNPKAMAFDKYGKLFTVDNDANLGDRCTIHYLIEGGEKGWHGGHQVMGNFFDTAKVPFGALNAWTVEKQWQEGVDKRMAGHLPPIATLRGGPSGMRIYPGLGLGTKYDNTFFVTNYQGSPGNSGIYNLTFSPLKGGYKQERNEHFAWGFGATDCAFGYDGKLYACDFGGGWRTNGSGKLVSFQDTTEGVTPIVNALAGIMKAGFKQRSSQALLKLLDHPDMRIRLHSQFALAKKSDALKQFSAATASDNVVTRLHGVWGLGQVARAGQTAASERLLLLLADGEEKVREQSAKALGTAGYTKAGAALTELLAGDSDHVRCLAAIAIGKLRYKPALPAVYAMIKKNNDDCAYIRHSGMMALLGTSTPEDMLAYATRASDPERLVVMLALRRLRDARLSVFLDDSKAFIVEDTIRAINDLNIEAAVPALAAYLEKVISGSVQEPSPITYRRLINANYRDGSKDSIDRLIRLLVSKRAQKPRETAAALLAAWNRDSKIDFTTGLWRPLPQRSLSEVNVALIKNLAALTAVDNQLKDDVIKLLATYQIKSDPKELLLLLANKEADADVRAQIFRSLLQQKNPVVMAQVQAYCDDKNEAISLQALTALGASDAKRAARKVLAKLAATDSISYKQGLVRTMAFIKTELTSDYLKTAMQKLTKGTLQPEIQLDVLESASARGAELAPAIAAYHQSLKADDPLAPFGVTAAGGDVARGFDVFHKSGTSQCRQCHFIGGTIKSAGPNLAGIGKRVDKAYILRALVAPSADVAPGFAVTTLALKDGRSVTGFLLSKDADKVTIKEGESQKSFNRSSIKSMSKAISSMPPMGLMLKKSEVRDLIAYLCSLKTEAKPGH